jgi:hypothetical protein
MCLFLTQGAHTFYHNILKPWLIKNDELLEASSQRALSLLVEFCMQLIALSRQYAMKLVFQVIRTDLGVFKESTNDRKCNKYPSFQTKSEIE